MSATPTFPQLMDEATDRAIDAVKQAQDASLRWTETAIGLFPTDPTFGVAGALPTPAEVVGASFDFAGKLLEQQRSYSLKLTELVAGAAARSAKAATKAPKA